MSARPRSASDLSPSKRELLARLLQATRPGASGAVLPGRGSDPGELSYAQERLWFLARLDPGLPAYNASRAWRLRGPLDREALARALAAFVGRHPALSATFPDVDGRPFVRTRSLEARLVTTSCDLHGDEPVRDAAASRFVAAAAREPFDLANGPLFRASLLAFGPDDHVLTVNTHHLVFDGASWAILAREMSELYRAASTVREPRLPVPTTSYADFVRWERAQSENGQLALAYWKEQLAGAPELTALPTDRPRAPGVGSHGARHGVLLESAGDLHAFSRRHGATLFMTMASAFAALLHAYTGAEDIVIGTPIANRPLADLEDVVGRFANMLPLRVRADGDPPFAGLLARVTRCALAGYAHQDVPFERLVDALQPRRSPSHSPLVQVACGVLSPSVLALRGMTVTQLDAFNGHSKFDLTLNLAESAGTVEASFEFKTGLFDEATIAGMADWFQHIARAVLDDPEQRLSALAPLAPGALQVQPAGRSIVAAPRAAAPAALAVGSLDAELAATWRKVLGVAAVGPNDDFFDLGGTSLLAVLLVARIEKRCGISLTPAVLFEAPTVAQLADRIRERGGSLSWSPLVAIQPNGSRPPLFCIHGAGGHVVGYADLARRLGADQPVYGLQAAGLDGHHPPETDLKAMAARYVSEIKGLQPRGPYHLSGLSFGGVVAFEMARILEARGDQVGLLALFDTARPGHWRALSTPQQLSNYVRRARYHGTQLIAGSDWRDYVKRKMRTARRRLRERMWRLAYLPYKVSGRALPRVLHQVGASHRAALKGYSPEPFAGRVTLFVARERAIDLYRGKDLGWTEYARGGVDVHEVAGDHVSLILEPAAAVLAAELRGCLERAQRAAGEESSCWT